MKTGSIEEAKDFAKKQSLSSDHRDKAIYLIYCSRTKSVYVDTNCLIRLWEQQLGYYLNGVFTDQQQHR